MPLKPEKVSASKKPSDTSEKGLNPRRREANPKEGKSTKNPCLDIKNKSKKREAPEKLETPMSKKRPKNSPDSPILVSDSEEESSTKKSTKPASSSSSEPSEPNNPPIRLPHNFPKWLKIKSTLKEASDNFPTLKAQILSYNIEKTGEWEFGVLKNFINDLRPLAKKDFFKVLSSMKTLALKLPKLKLTISPLTRNKSKTITMTQEEICSLLANGFLCTFNTDDKEDKKYGGRYLNFSPLFESFQVSINDEKLKCFMQYFTTFFETELNDELEIERIWMPKLGLPNWGDSWQSLRKLKIVDSVESRKIGVEIIETNQVFGGDLFGFTTEDEEIAFLAHPELMVMRLFGEPMADNEAIFVSGVRRYSEYKGHDMSFKYIGKSRDSRGKCFGIIGWENVEDKNYFARDYLTEELDKWFVLFDRIGNFFNETKGVERVTVGASRGDNDLRDQRVKFLIVLMAATHVGIKEVNFCVYEDEALKQELNAIQDVLISIRDNPVDVQELLEALCEYGRIERKGGLYHYLKVKFVEEDE